MSRSAYYDWRRSGAKIISSQTWQLYQRMKALFAESRSSLGSRQMMKQLRKEGHTIGRYRVRSLMKKIGLIVKRKRRFVLTTDSMHSHPVAENLLDRKSNPARPYRRHRELFYKDLSFYFASLVDHVAPEFPGAVGFHW